jgi:hypothetical protein
MKRILSLCLGWLVLACTAQSSPYNTARLDGRPSEYDTSERRASLAGAAAWGDDGLITNLYVTWDRQYLYVALQGWENNNKLVVLLDVDPTNGTGATTMTNWTGQGADYVRYNDYAWQAAPTGPSFGADYVIASEGYFHDVLRITYDGAALDTNEITQIAGLSGSSPHGTAVDIVALEGWAGCDLKGVEARIPWAVLYGTNRFGAVLTNEVVPRGAVLRVLAGIHNNDPNSAWSSPDTLPQQTGPNAFYTNGVVTSDTYIDVPIDQDSDGIPDGAESDVNGPYLIMLQGAEGGSEVLAVFNETVTSSSVSWVANWLIAGAVPASVELVANNQARIMLTNTLPAAASLVGGSAFDIADAAGNTNSSRLCFYPSSGGLATSVTVRFLLQTASGLGLNPGASNFFVNGSAVPLEWGYPPATTAPLQPLTNTWYYRDVVFPAGTPTNIYYKYSGQLTSGAKGTNNYEAVRLHNYADTSRRLSLPANGGFLVVTDYLGAAAHPWRDPNDATNGGYKSLYWDPNRGDSGVRQRTTMLFQLDLSKRDRRGITRVLLMGSDPLRGFNVNGNSPQVSDYATAPLMSWTTAGLTMYDDGTHGDAVAGDGVYSRRWAWTTNGLDAEMETNLPNSLVGGGEFSQPYQGTDYWGAQRSPRSFAYKFAVYKGGTGESLLSPTGPDLDYYIEDPGATNIVFAPYVWDNDDLPLPPSSNSPTMAAVFFTGATAQVLFTNVLSELQHGLEISTNLLDGWMDFGHRAVTNGPGLWRVDVAGATGVEMYRGYAGPAKPYRGIRWAPNPLPETGGVLRIEYCQHSRGLAGDRHVQIAGSFNGWTPTAMSFVGDGTWRYELPVSAADPSNIEFKARNVSGSVWEGMGTENCRAYKGTVRASWTPEVVTNGGLLTINYDAAGGNLQTSAVVYAHLGYDDNWAGTSDIPMTNVGGTVWTLSLTVPTNYNTSVNFVFNDGVRWDSESSAPVMGRLWRVFIAQP